MTLHTYTHTYIHTYIHDTYVHACAIAQMHVSGVPCSPKLLNKIGTLQINRKRKPVGPEMQEDMVEN